MKLGKNILLIVLFCSVGLVSARAVRQTITPVKSTVATHVIQSQSKQPLVQQGQSYAQALTAIRTSMQADQVWKDNRFTDTFVNFVKNSVHNSDYADIFARPLLEAGANLHVQFTGDNSIDKTIVIDINNEIDHQMNVLRVKPVEQPIIIKKTELSAQRMYLVPTDNTTLRKYDLCPLFTQKLLAFNKEEEAFAKELKQQGYSEEHIAQYLGKVSPHYSVFNENMILLSGEKGSGFENKKVDFNVSCVVPLGKFANANRTLMQLKGLDQFELAEKTGLSAAMCGGLSLNNGRLIRKYALAGDVQCLSDLHSIKDSEQFLRNLKIGDWLNAEVVRNNFPALSKELGVDGVDVSAVSTVSLFDSHLDKTPGFAVFNREEFNYVQNVKKIIRQGLQQDNYIHIMIVGNEEAVESLGHYFCFAIIKIGNEIQYVVLDTIPSAYHLQSGSHERDRLMFVIDNIERGSSSVNVINIRARFLGK